MLTLPVHCPPPPGLSPNYHLWVYFNMSQNTIDTLYTENHDCIYIFIQRMLFTESTVKSNTLYDVLYIPVSNFMAAKCVILESSLVPSLPPPSLSLPPSDSSRSWSSSCWTNERDLPPPLNAEHSGSIERGNEHTDTCIIYSGISLIQTHKSWLSEVS